MIREISSWTLDPLDGILLSPPSSIALPLLNSLPFHNGRFDGSAPEPREGLSSGHMPHSINLPSPNVLSKETSTTPAYKTMLSEDQLVKVFIEAMGEENWELVKKGERRVVNTCGSGMTVRLFARLEQLKHPTKLLTRVLSTSCRRQFFGWPYNERELVRMLRFTTRCVFLDFNQLCSLYVPKVRELKSSNMSHRAGLDTLPTKRARSSRKSKSKKSEIPPRIR